MAQLERGEIQCLSCKTWAPSPIQFGDSESFMSSTLIGNRFRCHSCGAMAPCNKENMRWAQSDGRGGWVGVDTKR